MTSSAVSEPAATDSEKASATSLIVVGAFSCLVVALQQTLVVPAVPQFPALLDTTAAAVSWLVTATLLTGAVATPIIGRLADLYGKRRMAVIAMIFVLIGSVLAPLGGIATLIAGRALQGVGTALVPVTMAQMRDTLPSHRVPSALAILSATLGIGGGVGIPLGGIVLATLDWTWMFWISAALAVVAIALIATVLPASSSDDQRGGFDLTGALLLSAALLLILMAVSQGETWGWGSVSTIASLVAGAAVLIWWAVFELRHPSPLVDLRTSGARPLLFTNAASIVLGILMFANLLLTTLRLQAPVREGGFDWSAGAAGLAMLPNAAAMFAVAPFTAMLARRFGPRTVLVLGSAVTLLGYVLTSTVTPMAWVVIVWTTVIGIGVGIGYAALPMLVARYAPLSEMGSANGFNALMRAVGSAVASALVGAISASFAVTVGGVPVNTREGLLVIGLVGVSFGILATLLSCFARARGDRQSTQAHNEPANPSSTDTETAGVE